MISCFSCYAAIFRCLMPMLHLRHAPLMPAAAA